MQSACESERKQARDRKEKQIEKEEIARDDDDGKSKRKGCIINTKGGKTSLQRQVNCVFDQSCQCH